MGERGARVASGGVRIPPHNIEAEQALIVACLINPGVIPQLKAEIRPEDCYRDAHRLILGSIYALRDRADIVTLAAELETRGGLSKVGGKAYLMSLVDAVSTSAGWRHWAALIKEAAVKREIIALSQVAVQSAQNGEDPAEILGNLKAAIRAVEGDMGLGELQGNLDLVNRAYRITEERSRSGQHRVGFLTGFENIDEHVAGLEPSCTYYLGAESTTGKTSLALNIAENVAQAYPGHVLYFTLESTALAVTFRRLAARSRVALTRLRTGNLEDGDQWERYTQAAGDLSDSRLLVFEGSQFQSYEKLAAFCETFAMTKALSLVIVDYIQLLSMRGTFRSLHELYRGLANRMNFLAKDLKCPVMLLSQLNKEGALKESGDLRNSADHEWILERKDKEAEYARLIGRKGKDVGMWSTWLRFDRFIQRWSDCDEQYER